ncbi:MAG: HAD family phosphatase [Lachnospiraceae bacterium]|nr:HAD family phosphatase [Lachnospiraceae bacterium]
MYDNITTVIFDMDGVLFDSENLDKKAWIELAEEYSIANIMEAFEECIGTPDTNIISVLDRYMLKSGAPISGAEFRNKTLNYFDRMVEEDGMPLKYYAAECLNELKEKGYKLGLASSTPIDRVVPQLTDTKLIGYFDDIIAGGMFSKGKPNPEIFLRSCERLGSVPSECIVIEDSFNGIRAAYSAGMKAIMVPDIIGPDDEMRNKAWKILPDLKTVAELLC